MFCIFEVGRSFWRGNFVNTVCMLKTCEHPWSKQYKEIEGVGVKVPCPIKTHTPDISLPFSRKIASYKRDLRRPTINNCWLAWSLTGLQKYLSKPWCSGVHSPTDCLQMETFQQILAHQSTRSKTLNKNAVHGRSCCSPKNTMFYSNTGKIFCWRMKTKLGCVEGTHNTTECVGNKWHSTPRWTPHPNCEIRWRGDTMVWSLRACWHRQKT